MNEGDWSSDVSLSGKGECSRRPHCEQQTTPLDPARMTEEQDSHTPKSHEYLSIPEKSVKVFDPHELLRVKKVDPKPSRWARAKTAFFSYFKAPRSKDQMRWAAQVGITQAILFLLMCIFAPTRDFFGQAALVGYVVVPVCNEATAGGSLRRNALIVLMAPCMGYFAHFLRRCSSGFGKFSNTWIESCLMTLSAEVLIIPVNIIRYMYTTVTAGVNMSLAVSENILLNNSTLSHAVRTFEYTSKQILALIICAVTSIIVTHSVFMKGARPTAATSLSVILTTMAKVLDPLANNPTNDDKVTAASSATLLMTSYPHLLATTDRMFAAHLNECTQDVSSTQPLRSPSLSQGRKVPVVSESSGQFSCRMNEIYESNKLTCQRMMDDMQVCQKLLGNQKDLLLAATQEISCHHPHRFPKKKYVAVLDEVRTLFYHVSALICTINVYLSTIDCRLKIAHQHAGGLAKSGRELQPLSQPFAVRHTKSAPETQKLIELVSLDDQRVQYHQGNRLSGLQPSVPSYVSHERVPDLYPAVCGEDDEQAIASLSGFGGTDLRKLASHVVAAMRLLADSLKNRVKTSTAAHYEIYMISKCLTAMSESRQHQRRKYSEIMLAALQADLYSSKSFHRFQEKLDWRGALFITPQQLRAMSPEEKAAFWEAYWLGRDRISTTERTLVTLKNSLVRLAYHIDNYLDVAIPEDATVVAMML